LRQALRLNAVQGIDVMNDNGFTRKKRVTRG
jgi:hypothetical protein